MRDNLIFVKKPEKCKKMYVYEEPVCYNEVSKWRFKKEGFSKSHWSRQSEAFLHLEVLFNLFKKKKKCPRFLVLTLGNLPHLVWEALWWLLLHELLPALLYKPLPPPALILSWCYHAVLTFSLRGLIRPHTSTTIRCWGLSFLHSLGLLGTVYCTYWRPRLQ